MRLFFFILMASWVGWGWMAQPSFELHAQEPGKLELCQQVRGIQSKIATTQKGLRMQSKSLKGDPELGPLDEKVTQAREAVKEANAQLKEAMSLYKEKRLEKIKSMPEAESLRVELESLKSQAGALQKQLRQAAACPKVSK